MRAELRSVLVVAALLFAAAPASAQFGSLISPGKLARAHADLEGLSNCQKCHEQGRKVTTQKCLTCHDPIARRITARKGVHRDVKNDCVACHVEHAGVDGELRPFDMRRFDHAAAAGYPLDGRHARIASDCKACHKGRSFLEASTTCASCHTDVHKPTLGRDCAACHTTQTPFADASARFDHTKAAFPLTGSHTRVGCEKCHANSVFRGVKFASCADCHRTPHERTLGPTCGSCHATETWRTKKIDHDKTAFALAGRHTAVACAECHRQPAATVKPKSSTCAACHADVHQGTFKEDCKACHTERGFTAAAFDHASTRFALTGKHAPVKCVACHSSITPTAADFRGLDRTCVSCHRDVHDDTLGSSCESCHDTAGFAIPAYVHKQAQPPSFFLGEHTPVACDKCHTSRPRPIAAADRATAHLTFTDASTTCSTCHTDVHLGQVGTDCSACHSIDAARFAVVGFSHTATKYPLTGRHAAVACDRCHKPETGAFPAATGTAVRLSGLATGCQSCHADSHAGQIAQACETCHTTTTFALSRFVHRARRETAGFFTGRHAAARCETCHKRETADFPSGRATAVRYAVDPSCVNCHTDVHRGRLGPRCIDCHKP